MSVLNRTESVHIHVRICIFNAQVFVDRAPLPLCLNHEKFDQVFGSSLRRKLARWLWKMLARGRANLWTYPDNHPACQLAIWEFLDGDVRKSILHTGQNQHLQQVACSRFQGYRLGRPPSAINLLSALHL